MPTPASKALKVHEAVLAVMNSVPVVRKEDRNAAQNFSFRGIDAVINAVGPALREHGVIVVPSVINHESKQVLVGRNQTPMNSVLILVKYWFYGPMGDSFDATVVGEAMDAGDKAFSKAMSVAFRTVLLQTLALPTDERDPDADAYERQAAENSNHTPATASTAKAPAKKPKSAADIARDDLLVKVQSLKYDPGEVAQMYLADMGKSLRDEVDDKKIADFTERLGATRR